MQVDTRELKTISEVAERFPSATGTGVSTTYLYKLMKQGRLELPIVKLGKGISTLYIIPLADQEKEDWGLGDRFQDGKD